MPSMSDAMLLNIHKLTRVDNWAKIYAPNASRRQKRENQHESHKELRKRTKEILETELDQYDDPDPEE